MKSSYLPLPLPPCYSNYLVWGWGGGGGDLSLEVLRNESTLRITRIDNHV